MCAKNLKLCGQRSTCCKICSYLQTNDLSL